MQLAENSTSSKKERVRGVPYQKRVAVSQA